MRADIIPVQHAMFWLPRTMSVFLMRQFAASLLKNFHSDAPLFQKVK